VRLSPCSGYCSANSHSYLIPNWQTQISWPFFGEGENESARSPWAICSLTNARDCGHVVRVYIHVVRASAIHPCHYDVQEKQISFEVAKRPCPSPHGSDKVANARGSVTRGDCKVKGIYADEKVVAKIYAEVACFPESHAEGNVSRTVAAEETGTGSARMDGGGVEKVVGASHGARGSCCAFHDASHPPRAF